MQCARILKALRSRCLNWNEQNIDWVKVNYSNRQKNMVTIVMPVYNRTIELERAVRSILHQDYTKWNLIIVGDRCLSQTAEVANKFMSEDDRIVFFNLTREKENAHRGCEQRNFACQYLAYTPYVAYLDDDNYWRKNHLSLALRLLENEKLDFVYMGVEDRSKFSPHEVIRYRNTDYYSWKARRIDTSCLVHKAFLIPKVVCWPEVYGRNDVDRHLAEQMIKANIRHKGSSKVTLVYFDHPRAKRGVVPTEYYKMVKQQVIQQRKGHILQ